MVRKDDYEQKLKEAAKGKLGASVRWAISYVKDECKDMLPTGNASAEGHYKWSLVQDALSMVFTNGMGTRDCLNDRQKMAVEKRLEALDGSRPVPCLRGETLDIKTKTHVMHYRYNDMLLIVCSANEGENNVRSTTTVRKAHKEHGADGQDPLPGMEVMLENDWSDLELDQEADGKMSYIPVVVLYNFNDPKAEDRIMLCIPQKDNGSTFTWAHRESIGIGEIESTPTTMGTVTAVKSSLNNEEDEELVKPEETDHEQTNTGGSTAN